MEKTKIEIMDTTLRDGEQTRGVSFLPHEKLMLARMLLTRLRVDRIEVASARVSAGEKEAVAAICKWAAGIGCLDKVEVLGFVDNHISLDWINDCGGKVINLLAKGSEKHCTHQLHKTLQEHAADIKESIAYATSLGIRTNLYLEDWSGGMENSRDFVWGLMDELKDEPVGRFILPDTLGILDPLQTYDYMRQIIRRYPGCTFEFHAHNDYDLAISNVVAAVLAGCRVIDVTVNGLGERAGNAPVSSVDAILRDHFNCEMNLDEKYLYEISRTVENYAGIAVAPNKPIVGESVFTQVAGVHADGDKKDNLYCNDLRPERFGRRREYALGKASGKANIAQNLAQLGLELTPEQTKQVTKRVVELGDKKELVTKDDLPYIVADVLKHSPRERKVKLLSYAVTSASGLKPMASVSLEVDGAVYEECATGDGQYDAFMRALRHIYKKSLNKPFPWLVNYNVTIPPGGRTDALVQSVITWSYEGRTYRTTGLDADQTESAVKATMKVLNLIENNDGPMETGAASDENIRNEKIIRNRIN